MESGPLYPIAAVEASTGIAKETLRVWERRYGFPMPVRDASGERLYDARQLQQLRDAKRLIDRGARPGQLFANGAPDESALELLAPANTRHAERFAGWIAMLAAFRIDDLSAEMQRELVRRGLPAFTTEVFAPLQRAVGEAWQSGSIPVAAEHLFTARATALLQSALLSIPATESQPAIVCATLAGETHGLGLLMAQAMLSAHGVRALDLGVDLPLDELVQSARVTKADIVMLSFSAHFPARQVPGLLAQLTSALPGVEVWVGGAGSRSVRSTDRIRCTQKLDELTAWVADWQFVRQLRDRQK